MKALDILATATLSLLMMHTPLAMAKGHGPTANLRAMLKKEATKQLKGNKYATSPKLQAYCVDLSGSWRGQCTDTDDPTPYNQDIVIDQYGCHELDINSQFYHISGVTTVGGTDPTFSYGGTAFTDWNAAGNLLRIRMNLAARSLGDDSFFVQVTGNDYYQLINGQLVYSSISQQVTDAGGQHVDQTYSESCTYDKVP